MAIAAAPPHPDDTALRHGQPGGVQQRLAACRIRGKMLLVML
jgi:hypothetical protein